MLSTTAFQLLYTTVFGWYSSFLFIRTGHLAAPFLAHAFCNHMGFPPVDAMFGGANPHAKAMALSLLAGAALFIAGVMPATEPSIFSNKLYLW
jgi:intramembrane prenyl-peptidase